jgi:hypothetical protein
MGNRESVGTHRSSVNSISAFVTSLPRASNSLVMASTTLPDCFVSV